MKWRPLLAALVGILLPLPLVALLSAALSGPGLGQARSQPPNVIPMLTDAERQNVLTYDRVCRTDADCDPRLRCFFSMVTHHSYCVDSRCMTDLQCPDGFACLTYQAENGKDLLKACSLVGKRKEGEKCAMFTRAPEYGCERGLLCHYRCGRPCRMDDPSSCPEGYFCEDDPTGAACQPSCEGRTCPEGLECISVGEHTSICARVNGQNCQRTPCARGETCSVNESNQPAGEVKMGCMPICSAEFPCAEGFYCDLWKCRKVCNPEDSSSCDAGLACERRYRDEELWLCFPPPPADGGT